MMAASIQPVRWPIVVGAALFGIGWGMSGLCPGPSLVMLPMGGVELPVFVALMFVGFQLARFLERRMGS